VTAYKLLLYPQDPDCAPVDTAALADALQAIGFIGAPVAVADGVFYPTGDRFLQLVTFLGCSPAIEVDPPADPAALEPARASGAFCHVYLASDTQLAFRADPRTPPPRCPACRQAFAAWQARIARWRKDPATLDWTCPACGHRGRLTELRFRKSGGFARTWVEVRGIHPAEAVPGEALLNRLYTLSGCRWQYSYLQE
jgi:hypothetical protein